MTIPWPMLRAILEGCTGVNDTTPLTIFSVDHDAGGVFGRGAGVRAVLDRLRETLAAGEVPRAVLLIGLYAEDDLRTRVVRLTGASELLDWPGLRYLRYLFDAEELQAATEAAQAGRAEPVPLPTRHELLACAAGAQHWLESLRKRHAGSAVIYGDAAEGSIILSRRMLEPAAWLSPEHRHGLARLHTCLHLAPGIGDGPALADLLQVEIDSLRATSDCLERLKAPLYSAPADPVVDDLRTLAEAAAMLDRAATKLLEHIREIAVRLRGAQ